MDAALFSRCLLALVASAALVPVWVRAEVPATTAAPSDASRQRQRQLEHAQLQSERDAIQARLLAQEADCYQRFAVTACLHQARSAARAQDTALLHQQHLIDDAERRDKAAQRQRTIQDKERALAERNATPPAAQGAVRGEPPQRVQGASQGPGAPQGSALQESAAAQQPQAQTERDAQARERYEAKQEKARLRRDAQEQRRAEDAAAGRVPAAPLPEPPALIPGSPP